jgi:hypothetical protein
MATADNTPATAKNGKSCNVKTQPELVRSSSLKPVASPKTGSLVKSAGMDISHPGTWLTTIAVNGRSPPSIAPQLAALFLGIGRFIKWYIGQERNSHAAITPTKTPDRNQPKIVGNTATTGCPNVKAANARKLTKMSGPTIPDNVTAKTHWLNV